LTNINSISHRKEDTDLPINITSTDDIVVCVIGVGYVGEHLLSVFGNAFNAIGFDVSPKRIAHIEPDFKHLPNVELTTDIASLARATHFLISVPTTLHEDNSVDASHLSAAISSVAQYARQGAVVVIESSVSVGMTRAFLSQYSGKLHCGMSPERVDPGRTFPTVTEIPKIVSGLDQVSMMKIYELYSQVYDKVVLVSRPEVAEMTKLYENCYRMINIAYVNEIADACAAHGIEANEVIDAASTKPFGFQAFRPGLGVGGHCIPVNPHYLLSNNHLPVLKHAAELMGDRPAKLARELYAERSVFTGKRSLRVLIIGVAFKPGQSVISYSPGFAFSKAMLSLGCKSLMFYDPLVPQSQASWIEKLPTAKFKAEIIDSLFDLVCVCVKQQGVDFSVVEDLRSAYVKYY
jgi:nucleotide sugar dehydrogenase